MDKEHTVDEEKELRKRYAPIKENHIIIGVWQAQHRKR